MQWDEKKVWENIQDHIKAFDKLPIEEQDKIKKDLDKIVKETAKYPRLQFWWLIIHSIFFKYTRIVLSWLHKI